MPVGIAVTKEQIDALSGSIARDIHRNIQRGLDLFQAMQDITDAQLTSLGYTTPEITDLRQALNDMQDLSKVYRGQIGLATPKDFRQSMRKIFGLTVN